MSIITIGIPTCNRKDIVYKNVIHTLTNLDSDDFEIVVVDNDSKDGTFEKLSEIKDKRFRLFKNDTNLGITRNVYKVIEYAKSDFVLLLSDEDFILVDVFKFLLNKLKSNFDVYNKFGVILFKEHFPFGNFSLGKDLYSILLHNDYISGNIFNKHFLSQIDYLDYNTIYPHTNIALKLSQVSEVLFINKKTYFAFTKDKKNYVEGDFIHPLYNLNVLKERLDIIKKLKYLSSNEFISLFSEIYQKCINSIFIYDVHLRSNFYREYFNLQNDSFSFSDACNCLLKYEDFYFNTVESLGIYDEKTNKFISDYGSNIINTLSARFKFDELIKIGYNAYILNEYDKSIFDEFNLKVNFLNKNICDLDSTSILVIEKYRFEEISKLNNNIILIDYDALLYFCTYLYTIIKPLRFQYF